MRMSPKFHEPTASVVEVASTALLSALRFAWADKPCECPDDADETGDYCEPCHRRSMLRFLKDAETDTSVQGYLVREFEEVFSDNNQDREP
jgi:hypothetical protein